MPDQATGAPIIELAFAVSITDLVRPPLDSGIVGQYDYRIRGSVQVPNLPNSFNGEPLRYLLLPSILVNVTVAAGLAPRRDVTYAGAIDGNQTWFPYEPDPSSTGLPLAGAPYRPMLTPGQSDEGPYLVPSTGSPYTAIMRWRQPMAAFNFGSGGPPVSYDPIVVPGWVPMTDVYTQPQFFLAPTRRPFVDAFVYIRESQNGGFPTMTVTESRLMAVPFYGAPEATVTAPASLAPGGVRRRSAGVRVVGTIG
jgi:hypothetical protein